MFIVSRYPQDSILNVKSTGGQKDCEESEVVNNFMETAFSDTTGQTHIRHQRL